MTDFAENAAKNLTLVRERKPLVHNITNYVVMNSTANALLAMGASPVMAHAPNEVEEMVRIAGALVLNIGTLDDAWVAAMIRAAARAAALGKPIVLDPVGAGATRLRTVSAKALIAEATPAVIRGNASEVLALGESVSGTKGVDSVHSVADAAEAAAELARELGTVLAITGPEDLVTDGNRTARVANGHSLMGTVTGTGCTATAVTGAFLAVDDDPLRAAATALAYYGLAGEVASEQAGAPGSYAVALIDALYTIDPERLCSGVRITVHR
jgi:hydroxyethylthiazole kinase